MHQRLHPYSNTNHYSQTHSHNKPTKKEKTQANKAARLGRPRQIHTSAIDYQNSPEVINFCLNNCPHAELTTCPGTNPYIKGKHGRGPAGDGICPEFIAFCKSLNFGPGSANTTTTTTTTNNESNNNK